MQVDYIYVLWPHKPYIVLYMPGSGYSGVSRAPGGKLEGSAISKCKASSNADIFGFPSSRMRVSLFFAVEAVEIDPASVDRTTKACSNPQAFRPLS